MLVDETIDLFSAETLQQIATWSPKHRGDWVIRAELRQDDNILFSQEQTTTVTQTASETTYLQFSSSAWLPILIVALALTAVGVVTGRALYDRSH